MWQLAQSSFETMWVTGFAVAPVRDPGEWQAAQSWGVPLKTPPTWQVAHSAPACMPLSVKPVVSWSNCCDGAAPAPAPSNSRQAPASQPPARAREPLCLVAVTLL